MDVIDEANRRFYGWVITQENLYYFIFFAAMGMLAVMVAARKARATNNPKPVKTSHVLLILSFLAITSITLAYSFPLANCTESPIACTIIGGFTRFVVNAAGFFVGAFIRRQVE